MYTHTHTHTHTHIYIYVKKIGYIKRKKNIIRKEFYGKKKFIEKLF